MFNSFRRKEIARPTSDADKLLALSDTDFADLCARMIRNEDSGVNAMVVVAYANIKINFPSGLYALVRELALEKERRKTNAPPSDNNAKATMNAADMYVAEFRTLFAGMTEKDRMAITKSIEDHHKSSAAVCDEMHAFEAMVHRYEAVFRLIFRLTFENLTSPTDDEINRRRHEYFLRALLLYRLMQKASANPSINGTVVEIWAALARSGQYLKSLLEHVIIWSEAEKVWFAGLKDANDGVSYIVNMMVPKRYRANPIFQEIAKKHQFYVSML